MPFKHMTKRLGILTVAAVTALSLIPTTSASAVAATPASPSNVNIIRAINAGTVTIKPGETVSVSASVTLDSTYFTGSAISGSTTFEVSWATPALNGATLVYSDYYWSSNPWISGSTNSSTWTTPGTALTSLNANVYKDFKNTTSSNITLTLDPAAVVLKRAGTTIGGLTPNFNATKRINSYGGGVTSPFTIATDDGYTYFNFNLCLSSTTNLAANDVVTAEVTAKKDNVSITVGTGSDMVANDVEFDSLTRTLTAPISTTNSVMFMGHMNSPGTGSYAITAVLKKGSEVVGGACASVGPGPGPSSAFPTTFTKVGTGSMAVTSPTTSAIASTKLSNSSVMSTGSSVDGTGGEFYWGKNTANKYVLTRMIAGTGIDPQFGGAFNAASGSGAGYIVLPVTRANDMSPVFLNGVGSYTSTNSKWVAAISDYSSQAGPSYKLLLGSNTSRDVTTKSVTFASLKTVCGDTTLTGADIFPIATSTDVPLVEVSCGKWDNVSQQQTGSWVVVAKFNPAANGTSVPYLTAVTTIGSKTTCLSLNAGMNGPSLPITPSVNAAAATGKQAVALYAGQASACGGMTPTIAKGFLVTLKTDGSLGYKKEYTSAASMGLNGITPAPSLPRALSLAPGLAANEWVTASRIGATSARVINVSSVGVISAGSTVNWTNTGDYNTLNSSLVPLKVLSNKTVVFLRRGYSTDGKTIVSSIAKAPTATVAGAKTLVTGQGIKSTGGNVNARNILNYSYNTKAPTVGWFGVMGATSFKSAKWTLPTS